MSCLVVPSAFAVNNDEAGAAVGRAETRMIAAYKYVLEAELEGANVSSLLLRLNVGSALLSMAQMQFRVGNFSAAVDYANQCYDSLSGIETEANNLRDYAVMEQKQRMLITFVGSSFAIGIVTFGSVFGWRFFRKKYYQQVLEMKPEVQAHDSE